MKAHGSYSDTDGGENYIAVRDNVHLKLEQQLPLNGPWKGRKSIILDNLDKFKQRSSTKIECHTVGAPGKYTPSWEAEIATYG